MKASNVLKVITNLEKVLPYAQSECSLNMDRGTVSAEKGKNLCGTAQCHAGWYTVATFPAKQRMDNNVDYYDGAVKMGKHLGFKSKKIIDDEGLPDIIDEHMALTDWAGKNPEIWGNRDGALMFECDGEMAFYHVEKRPYGAETLQHIVDHWKEVYARLLALENPEEKREDITAKLAILPVDETLDTIKTQVYETVS